MRQQTRPERMTREELDAAFKQAWAAAPQSKKTLIRALFGAAGKAGVNKDKLRADLHKSYSVASIVHLSEAQLRQAIASLDSLARSRAARKNVPPSNGGRPMEQPKQYDIDAEFEKAQPADAGPATFNLDPIPAGTRCLVVVSDQKFKVLPGAKGTKTCKVTFEVVEPPDHNGRRIWHDFWLTPNNLAILKRDLTTLGWKGDKISSLMNVNDASLVGLGAEIIVGITRRDWTDRETGETSKRDVNTVKVFAAPWTPPPPPPPEAGLNGEETGNNEPPF